MAKAKRVYRRRYTKKNKYNIETNPGIIPLSSWQSPATEEAFNYSYNETVVPSSEVEGVRKVKNLTVSLAYPNPNNDQKPIFWALVYVPEGTIPNYLNQVGDLYQPSQWVLSSGILNTIEGKSRIYTPLSKNLNKGDKIVLCLGTEGRSGGIGVGAPDSISYLVRYAICFN